jgi:hypothetical protein
MNMQRLWISIVRSNLKPAYNRARSNGFSKSDSRIEAKNFSAFLFREMTAKLRIN